MHKPEIREANFISQSTTATSRIESGLALHITTRSAVLRKYFLLNLDLLHQKLTEASLIQICNLSNWRQEIPAQLCSWKLETGIEFR